MKSESPLTSLTMDLLLSMHFCWLFLSKKRPTYSPVLHSHNSIIVLLFKGFGPCLNLIARLTGFYQLRSYIIMTLSFLNTSINISQSIITMV